MKTHYFLNKKTSNRVLTPNEYHIHCAIADYLDTVIKSPSRWCTVEVSNQANGKAAMIRQKMLKRKGVVTGWPDIQIIIVTPETTWSMRMVEMIFFEIKAPKENPTEKQNALHDELRQEGHSVYVVRSVDDVIAALKKEKVI